MATPIISQDALIALLGVLAGAFVTYRFSLGLSKRQFQQLREISKLDAKHNAAARFRSALIPELIAIEQDDLGHYDLHGYLRNSYTKHATAVAEFDAVLNDVERLALQHDWNVFRYGEQASGEPSMPDIAEGLDHEMVLYLCYSDGGFILEKHIQASPHKKATDRIKKLISHARCS